MTIYLLALAFTIGIELLVVALVLRFAGGLQSGPALLTCVWLNLLTHPLASLSHLQLSLPLYWIELGIVLVEAAGYRWVASIPTRWSILLAVLANIVSVALGTLASAIMG